jgi:hypothetical protein
VRCGDTVVTSTPWAVSAAALASAVRPQPVASSGSRARPAQPSVRPAVRSTVVVGGKDRLLILAVMETMRRWLMGSYSCGIVLSLTFATSRSRVAACPSFSLTGIMPTSALEFIWAGGTWSWAW